MRVLVTGGGGYLGLVLSRVLLEHGWHVRIVDRFLFGRAGAEALASHEGGKLELITGDIRVFEASWLDDVQAVCHLAAISSDPTADHAPQEAWSVNAEPIAEMVEMMRAAGVRRCILASTASLYDGCSDGVCTEESIIVPRGTYALSKAAAELALLAAHDENFAPVVLRMGTLYGPSPRMRFDLVVNAFVRAALLERTVTVHGEGAISRPIVAIEDAAQAFLKVLEAPRERIAGRTFNVVGANLTIREIADQVVAICQRERRDVRSITVSPPERMRDYRASAVAAGQQLGWSPRVDLPTSVLRMLNFYALFQPNQLTDIVTDNNAFVMKSSMP